MINIKSIKEKLTISSERKEAISKTLITVKDTTITVAKYGGVFTGGVLIGSVLGCILFFKISDGDF